MKVLRARGAPALSATTLLVVATCFLAPTGWTAGTRMHRFSASYTGTGRGVVSGKAASGTATLTGHGKLIGASTLSGSAHGSFVSSSCVVFRGTATLKGARGSIRLSTRGAKACTAAGNANHVSFSGRTKVVRGASAFAGAHGALTFTGGYSRSSRAVTISLKGRITH